MAETSKNLTKKDNAKVKNEMQTSSLISDNNSNQVTDYTSIASTDSCFLMPIDDDQRQLRNRQRNSNKSEALARESYSETSIDAFRAEERLPQLKKAAKSCSENAVKTTVDTEKTQIETRLNTAFSMPCSSPSTANIIITSNMSTAKDTRNKQQLLNLDSRPVIRLYSASESESIESFYQPNTSRNMLSPKEQNKLRFEQMQQRLASSAKPFNNMFGSQIVAVGETSTDQDFPSNEYKMPKLLITSPNGTIRSSNIKNNFSEMIDEDIRTIADSSRPQLTTAIEDQRHPSVSALRKHRSLDKANTTELKAPTKTIMTNDSCNNLLTAFGKILRNKDGGIPALYRPGFEQPNSLVCKLVHAMLV